MRLLCVHLLTGGMRVPFPSYPHQHQWFPVFIWVGLRDSPDCAQALLLVLCLRKQMWCWGSNQGQPQARPSLYCLSDSSIFDTCYSHWCEMISINLIWIFLKMNTVLYSILFFECRPLQGSEVTPDRLRTIWDSGDEIQVDHMQGLPNWAITPAPLLYSYWHPSDTLAHKSSSHIPNLCLWWGSKLAAYCCAPSLLPVLYKACNLTAILSSSISPFLGRIILFRWSFLYLGY